MTRAKHYRRESPPPRNLAHACVECNKTAICRARIARNLHLMCEMHGMSDYISAARANGYEGKALLNFENNICPLPEFRFGYEAGLFGEAFSPPETDAFTLGFSLGAWVLLTTGGRTSGEEGNNNE